MDLLGGYNSDGDSSSASSSSSTHSKKRKEQQPQNPPTQRRRNHDDLVASRKLSKETGDNSIIAANKQKQKGKRLLKLNAVLPPEILERLTRSTVLQRSDRSTSRENTTNTNAAADEWSESDSDSEDEQRGRINNRPPVTSANVERGVDLMKKSDDAELCSLLNDLKNHIPTVGQKVIRDTCGKITGQDKEEKLGMAFMNAVSTSVVRKKRNEHLQPVDIHGYSSLRTHAKTTTNNLDSASNASEDSLPQPFQDQKNQMTDIYKAMSGVNEVYTNATIHDRVQNQNEELNPESVTVEPSIPSHAFAGIKRAMNAAPSVTAATWSEAETDTSYMQQVVSPVVQESPDESTSISNPARKRSKRELEKALRAGNFDSLQGFTQKIEAPNQMPHDASSILMEGGGGGGGSSFGTSGLERYVPSEGTALKQAGLSAKMKGKHQIHSLVQSASKYEADQRRIAAMSMGQQGKSKRADAKKKYGW